MSNPTLVLHLYVEGDRPSGQRAIDNAQALCRLSPNRSIELVVIDIVSEPRRAFEDGILTTPLLRRVQPQPEIRLAGDLSHRDDAAMLLGLHRHRETP